MPEILGLIATLVIVLLIIYRLQHKPIDDGDVVVESGLDSVWLQYRWKMADEAEASGGERIFHAWFFYPPTERQLTRLKDMKATVEDIKLTKGKVSRMITKIALRSCIQALLQLKIVTCIENFK